MRRPRQKLQVNTFPFLAVLLCAMGALVLLLLVMDRRAKFVARTRLLLATQAQREAQADKLSEAEANRLADWQRERDRLHQTLAQQEKELREHLAGLLGEIGAAGKHVAKHEASYVALQQQVTREHQMLLQEKTELDRQKAGMAAQSPRELAARTELERLTIDLLQLERSLRDLRDLKSRPTEAFSLVPYRGRHGDKRRPVYVECNHDGLVLHPGSVALDNDTLTSMRFREEVARRAGTLVRESPSESDARRSPRNQGAYILFLVRPDGIENYYKAQSALRGYEIDFGYELVEAHWTFDFSNSAVAGQQPWNQEGGAAKWSSPTSLDNKTLLASRPPSSFSGPPGTEGSGEPGGGSGRPGWPHSPSVGPSSPDPASGSGVPSRPGGVVSLGPPQGLIGVGTPGGTAGSKDGVPGTGPFGSAGGAPLEIGFIPGAPRGSPGSQLVSRHGSPGFEGSGAGEPTFSVLAPVLPPSGLNMSGQPGKGSLFASAAPGNAPGSEDGQPAGAQRSAGAAGQQSASSGASSGTPSGASPGSSSGPASPLRAPGQAGSENAGGSPGGNEDGSAEPGPGAGKGATAPRGGRGSQRGSSGSSLWLGGSSGGPRSAPPTLGKLLSNHDYVINLECIDEGVVLYPRNELYPMNPSANQSNVEAALVQAIQQQIDRRQSTVRRGETPYRPMIRLQIQPEGRRAYYWIYPVLEGLRIPMIRENVDE